MYTTIDVIKVTYCSKKIQISQFEFLSWNKQ